MNGVWQPINNLGYIWHNLCFQVVQSSTSPVTCSTTAVRSNFKFGYHVFGQQEASFQDVEFQGDMVLIARLYLKKRHSDALDDFMMPEQGGQEASLYDEETCVAWAYLPLVQCDESKYHKITPVFQINILRAFQKWYSLKSLNVIMNSFETWS